MKSVSLFKRFTSAFFKARAKGPNVFAKVTISQKTGRVGFGTTKARDYRRIWCAGNASFNGKFVFVPGLQICGDLKSVKVIVDAMFGAIEQPTKSQKERMRILKSAFTLENHTDNETLQEWFLPVVDESSKKIIEIKEAVSDEERVSYAENFKTFIPKKRERSRSRSSTRSLVESDKEAEMEVEESGDEERESSEMEAEPDLEEEVVPTQKLKTKRATSAGVVDASAAVSFSQPLPPVSSPRRGTSGSSVVTQISPITPSSPRRSSSPKRLSPRRLPKDWALITPSTRQRVSIVSERVKALPAGEFLNLKTMRISKTIPKGAIQIPEEPKIFFMPIDVGYATSYIALTRKIPLSFARAVTERAAQEALKKGKE